MPYKDYISCKKLVEEVLSEIPETRDDDTLLLLHCWKRQGINITINDDVLAKLKKCFSFESVRRRRQKFQEDGLYLGENKQGRYDEAKKFAREFRGGELYG